MAPEILIEHTKLCCW